MRANANTRNAPMNVPTTVVGFGLVAFGRAILGQSRAFYLKQASKSISIDISEEIILRYAAWYCTYPLLCFGLSVMFGVGVTQGSPYPRAIIIYKIACVFFLLGGLFLSYRQWKARVKIFDGKLIYTEGDRFEISANEVDSVRLTGFTFIVKKRSEKVVRIPATFEHSEIILAFLNQAAVNK